MLNKKTSNYDLEFGMVQTTPEYNNEDMELNLGELKSIIGDMFEEELMKLALKKTNLALEEALLMLTDESQADDLREELRKGEEIVIPIIDDKKPEENKEEVEDGEKQPEEESKLNLIISNKGEYFDLLFELLNLGVYEITTQSWALLTQIPVNKRLYENIRALNIDEPAQWDEILDPRNIYKLLYSLQILNSLICSPDSDALSEGEIQERLEWRLRFIEKGGFEHLFRILIQISVEDTLGTRAMSSQKKARRRAQEQQSLSQNQTEALNNAARCLGYLINMVKIFIQAALLSSEEETNLMNVVA